jgi:GNAT superfamily N-acetyltransferase
MATGATLCSVTITVRVERLTVDESPRLRAIRLRALADAPDAFGTTFEEAAAQPAEIWSEQLQELPTFVAVNDGLDIGMVRCQPDETEPDTAFLISMWVAPAERRKGAGDALIDAAVEWARTNGVKRLLLDVVDDNAAAIALYARKGFQPTGEVTTLPPPRDHIREHQRELRL